MVSLAYFAASGRGEPEHRGELNPSELHEVVHDYHHWARDAFECLDVTLDFPVRIGWMKRAAGEVISRGYNVEYVTYSRVAFKHMRWEEFAAVMRHELIHVHTVQNSGEAGHGEQFEVFADKLATTKTCIPFAKPKAKYVLRCGECYQLLGYRFQSCPRVRNPESYESPCCGAAVTVEENTT